jgi:ubiquinone/menaquinone biosynthesis C-methylase UbiE
MVNYQDIYANQAELYEQLIAREDYEGNILATLHEICSLEAQPMVEVIEFGAGTGRLTRLLAPHVKSIRAFDASAPMLSVADTILKSLGITNCTLEVADNKHLPVPNASADIAIAGWSFGHATAWQQTHWQAEIKDFLDEMRRVLRPNGMAIILETMGTGQENPAPPTSALAEYYNMLEHLKFSPLAIRTDYRFESLEEAERLVRFFFGDELAKQVIEKQSVILPECTGIWWLSLA